MCTCYIHVCFELLENVGLGLALFNIARVLVIYIFQPPCNHLNTTLNERLCRLCMLWKDCKI